MQGLVPQPRTRWKFCFREGSRGSPQGNREAGAVDSEARRAGAVQGRRGGGGGQANGSVGRLVGSKSALQRLGEQVPVRERLVSQLRPIESSNRWPRERVAAPVERVGNSGGSASCGSAEVRAPTPTDAEEVIEQLRRRVEELEKKVEVQDNLPESEVRMAAPFTPSIMAAPLPRDLRLPTIKAYTGSSDPRVHMTRYKAAMMMIGADDAVTCRGFLSTLDGATQDWFNTLPNGSIPTFAELTKSFLSYFSNNIQHKKPFSHLCTVKQAGNESLRDFIDGWKNEVSNVYDFDGKVAVSIFTHALRSGEFYKHLNTHPARGYDKLMRTAACFAGAEEADRRKRDEEEGKGRTEKPPPTNQGTRSVAARKGNNHPAERPREPCLVTPAASNPAHPPGQRNTEPSRGDGNCAIPGGVHENLSQGGPK